MSVCDSWPSISSVIPATDFIGWGDPSVKRKNCYDYCVAQLAKAGFKLASPGWTPGSGLVFQTFIGENNLGLQPGVQGQAFVQGVEYTKIALASGVPVMFGVDNTVDKSPNRDKVTDHFIVIVGMGTDGVGNYFLFFDNSTASRVIGTSNLNRIYCNCEANLLMGVTDQANRYGQGTNYTITQIRKSIKK